MDTKSALCFNSQASNWSVLEMMMRVSEISGKGEGELNVKVIMQMEGEIEQKVELLV
jgi:hypothetical protein